MNDINDNAFTGQPVNNTQTYKQTRLSDFTQKHVSLFVRGLLYAGIGYIVIGVFSFLCWFLIDKYVKTTNTKDQTFYILMVVSAIVILVSAIMGIVASFKLARNTLKIGLMISIWAIYVIAQTAAFAVLFYCFTSVFTNVKGLQYLLLIFAGGGLAFVLSALIAKAMSTNAVIKFSRFIFIISIGFMVAMLISIILNVVLYCAVKNFNSEIIYTAMISVSILIFFLYMIFDMSMLAKAPQLLNLSDDQQQIKLLALFFGYRILVDLIALIWRVALLVLQFAGKKR